MPADKRRKIVTLRFFPEELARLDSLCVDRTKDMGRIVHRSEMVSLLIATAYGGKGRERDAKRA